MPMDAMRSNRHRRRLRRAITQADKDRESDG